MMDNDKQMCTFSVKASNSLNKKDIHEIEYNHYVDAITKKESLVNKALENQFKDGVYEAIDLIKSGRITRETHGNDDLYLLDGIPIAKFTEILLKHKDDKFGYEFYYWIGSKLTQEE